MTDFTPPRPWISSYATGVPEDIEAPEGSLYDLVAASAAEFGPQVALEFFGRTTTYTQLIEQIDRAAEGLRLLGARAEVSVAFEDSRTGIASATAAGIATIGIKTSLLHADLIAAGAVMSAAGYDESELLAFIRERVGQRANT